jgi:hypothetical protein
MTNDASLLMDEALKVVKLNGSFSPAEIGARVGLSKLQAESAARALSNAGVIELGFDCAAFFSSDFRKARTPIERKAAKPKAKRARKAAAKVTA